MVGPARAKIDQEYLHSLLQALQAVRAGNFSARLPTDQIGLPGKIGDAFNDIVSANERMAQELERVGQVVGREGRTRKRVQLGVTAGAWGEMEGSVNALIDDLLVADGGRHPRCDRCGAGRPPTNGSA